MSFPAGATVVRAEAEIRYLAPRPDDERIPSTARVLDITVASNPSHPSLSLAVDTVNEVTQIAHIAKSLRVSVLRSRPGAGLGHDAL